jgi:hypothetical protein
VELSTDAAQARSATGIAQAFKANTTSKAMDAGQIPSVCLGGQRRIPRRRLIAWLDGLYGVAGDAA